MCMTVPAQVYQAGVEALMNSSQLQVHSSFTFTINLFVTLYKEDINTLNHHINDTQGLGRKARIIT